MVPTLRVWRERYEGRVSERGWSDLAHLWGRWRQIGWGHAMADLEHYRRQDGDEATLAMVFREMPG